MIQPRVLCFPDSPQSSNKLEIKKVQTRTHQTRFVFPNRAVGTYKDPPRRGTSIGLAKKKVITHLALLIRLLAHPFLDGIDARPGTSSAERLLCGWL